MKREPRAELHHDVRLLALCKPAGMPSVPDETADRTALDQGRAAPGATLPVVHRQGRNLVASVSEGAGAERAETRWQVLLTLWRSCAARTASARLPQPRVAGGGCPPGLPAGRRREVRRRRLLADRSIGLHARSLALPRPFGGEPGLVLEPPLPACHLWNLARRWLARSGLA